MVICRRGIHNNIVKQRNQRTCGVILDTNSCFHKYGCQHSRKFCGNTTYFEKFVRGTKYRLFQRVNP